jgi:hypothetical protein
LLGTSDYDIARTSYLGVGYYPTKNMTDTQGYLFKPGLFGESYLFYDLIDKTLYAYLQSSLIFRNDFSPKLLQSDLGLAWRPFEEHKRLEFRLGVNNTWDIMRKDAQTGIYAAIRFTF